MEEESHCPTVSSVGSFYKAYLELVTSVPAAQSTEQKPCSMSGLDLMTIILSINLTNEFLICCII